LSDDSAWRIWPVDMADTLQWLPTTEIKIRKIDDEACSHALINQSDGSRVRVIEAYKIWAWTKSDGHSAIDRGGVQRFHQCFALEPFFVREVELLIARPLQLIWHTKAIVLPCGAKEP